MIVSLGLLVTAGCMTKEEAARANLHKDEATALEWMSQRLEKHMNGQCKEFCSGQDYKWIHPKPIYSDNGTSLCVCEDGNSKRVPFNE